MKKQRLKLKMLLAFFLISCCIGSYAETIKILAIGNSFSEDAVENYLWQLAQADDVTLIIGNMYIGGCSMETHWNNANNNNAAYSYRKIVNGVKNTTDNTTLETAITDEDWDYITFQQVSNNSGLYNTYFPYFTNLLAYVKTKVTNPEVKYGMHMTWAYQQNSTHSGFASYNRDQMTMYNAIIDAVPRVAAAEGVDIIIPSGTAIQNARTSYIGDNFCRDGYHLDVNIGRYTAACTWYEKLTGNNVLGNSYVPSNFTPLRAKIAQTAAHDAVITPYAVTELSDETLGVATGNFNGWNLTTTGHGGINGGKMTFEEKDMTLELWLYIDDSDTRNVTGVNVISNRHNGNNGFSVNLYDRSGNIDPRFFFRTNEPKTLFLPRESFSNQWAHMAFVVSSTDRKAYAYLNGELYETIEDIQADWVGNRTNNDDLWIGYWYDGQRFYGKMADIRVWNVARTAEEIAENYNVLLKGDEPGLFLYYNFDIFDQAVINVANPGTNNGKLQPDATWNTTNSYEVLAQKPVNITVANDEVTWEADGESWDVEVISTADGSILKSETVDVKSLSLSDLDEDAEYYINIRTFNELFYSNWATTKVEDNPPTSINKGYADNLIFYSINGTLHISSANACLINVFAIDGRLVRSINVKEGINSVDGLVNGIYIINNQKVIVK